MDRHGLDAISLLFGGLFAVVGMLLIAGAGIQLVTGSWIAPAVAIVFGIVLLIAAPRPARRGTSAETDETPELGDPA